MKLKHSLFIDIDGIDGTGKSTSTRILQKMLTKKNVPVLFTSEPEFQGSAKSKAIHNIITDDSLHLTKDLQVSLFIIARALHIKEVIKPAMKQHKLIITDRYVLSNLAYQGNFTKGINQSGIESWQDTNKVMYKNLHDIKDFKDYLPDLNFYFYMKPSLEIERLIGRPEKEDSFDIYLEHKNNLKKLQKNYHFGIQELSKYNSPTISIDSGKKDQYQRAVFMYKKIIKLINKDN